MNSIKCELCSEEIQDHVFKVASDAGANRVMMKFFCSPCLDKYGKKLHEKNHVFGVGINMKQMEQEPQVSFIIVQKNAIVLQEKPKPYMI